MKVSVIVPVWGVERFIERCARSLFEQSMDSIEFIFVDDCTPDRSMEILDAVIKEYPSRCDNIKILHHNINRGLPQARQTGINAATGEYIIHCDSDDWVDKELYERMYLSAASNNLDVVVCQMKETDGNVIYDINLFPDAIDKSAISNSISDWLNEGSLCNKMFRRSIYHKEIVTPVGAMAEDKCMVLQLIYYCRRIGLVTDCNYYIWKNPDSICRAKSVEKVYNNFKDGVDNYKIVENFYKIRNALTPDEEAALFKLKYTLRDNLRPLIRNYTYYKIWMSTFPELNRNIMFNKLIPLRQRVRSVLIKYRIFPFPWSRN